MRRTGLFAVWLASLLVAGIAGAFIGRHVNGQPVATTTTTTASSRSTTSTTVSHAGVTVQVANGTLTPGAAAHFTQLLQSQGWATSTPANATSQVSASNVYYAPGKQAQAMLVASQVGVAASAVLPLTPSVPLGTTLGVDVVVMVGPDLAAQATTSTTATT